MAVASDGLMCAISVWIAYAIRIGGWQIGLGDWARLVAICLLFWYPIALVSGVYRSLIRFSGARTVFALITTAAFYTVPVVLTFSIVSLPPIPRTFGVLQPIIFVGLIVGTRILVRFFIAELIQRDSTSANFRRVMIYGAGRSGQQLSQSLRHERKMVVLGFIDDDMRLNGQRLDGHPVYGSDRLDAVLADVEPDEIFLALPNISRARRKEIFEKLQKYDVYVRSLPSVGHIIDGRVTVNDLREIQIDELLGRDPVAPNHVLMGKTILGKTVLVSGAGGSIGSELCRQIIGCRPVRLILLEQSEFALFAIEQELRELNSAGGFGVEISAELGNVAERAAMLRVFRRYSPHTVFHAAAYKHVPLVEANPIAGLFNNIMGTLHSLLAAEEVGVSHFTLISTDKAVRPTNVMGASKRVCELILQARARNPKGDTIFSMVRFGNVLGSSGSVVPRFKAQIEAGGPITITHRDITRYFMTIPEASQLVIQASAMARGGEVFLLDMGQPVRIVDLARTMIRLSGLSVRDEQNPDGDIEIEEIGLRPGEKLFEELLIDEGAKATFHSRIMCADEPSLAWPELEEMLTELHNATRIGDVAAAMKTIRQLVPEYHASPLNLAN